MPDTSLLPEPQSEPDVQAPSQPATYERLLRALAGLALFATVLGVGRHVSEALTSMMPESGPLMERLAAVPLPAWVFAALHVLCAILSLVVGYWLISCAYPFRGLARLAVINPAAAIQAGHVEDGGWPVDQSLRIFIQELFTTGHRSGCSDISKNDKILFHVILLRTVNLSGYHTLVSHPVN